jgi:hypothetical protein
VAERFPAFSFSRWWNPQRGANVALKYEEINRFVREKGKVTALAKKGAVTLLKNGETDSVAFFEKDAVQFKHNGKTYTRKEFEKLVRGERN